MTFAKFLSAAVRCLRLLCPVCGRGAIFRAPFRVAHHCEVCGALFDREQGYFVGALSVSVGVTELAILAIYFICLLSVGFDEGLIVKILLPAAVACPFVFYHHSWSVWLTIDNAFEKLPRSDK